MCVHSKKGVLYKPGSSPSPASDSTGTGSGLASLQTCEKGISSFKSPCLWYSVTECKMTKMTFNWVIKDDGFCPVKMEEKVISQKAYVSDLQK